MSRNTEAQAAIESQLDSARRIALAASLGISERVLARVVLSALDAEPSESRRYGLAAATFLALRERHRLTVEAWTEIISRALPLIEPRDIYFDWLAPGPKQRCWFAIRDWLATSTSSGSLGRLEQNYLSVGLGCWWPPDDWRRAIEQLRADLDVLGVHDDAIQQSTV